MGGLFFLTIILKVFALLREVLVAKYIGMNNQTDAFNMAIFATTIITGVAGVAISSSLIPILSSENSSDNKLESSVFTSLSVLILLLFLFLLIPLVVFSGYIFKILAPGFTDENIKLTINLFKIASIKIIIVILITLITQYLNKKNIFYSPMLASSMGSVMVIIFLGLMKENSNISNLMLITVFSDLIQMIWLFGILFKNGYRVRFDNVFKITEIKVFLEISMPIVISYGIQQLGLFVNRGLASNLGQGNITALTYANSIVMMINMTLSLSLASIIYPKFVLYNINKEYKNSKILIQNSYKLSVFLLLPATFGMYILSDDICILMLQRGSFTSENALLTSKALSGFTLSLLPYAFYEITLRFFYSMKRTKDIMKINILGTFLYVITSYAIIIPFGIFGLSLANGIMIFFMVLNFIYKIQKNHFKIFDKNTNIFFIKIFASSLIMLVFLMMTKEKYLFYGKITQILLKITFSVIIYLFIVFIMFYNESLKKTKYFLNNLRRLI